MPVALKHLPPFPPVAARVMRLLGNEDVSFSEIASLIKTDAALSGEVIRLANSPLVSARHGASTVLQALTLLGIARINGLILTLGMSSFLRKAGKSETVRRCWRHNLACAFAAKEFARTFDIGPDMAYTAGLLHDLGRLALLVTHPAEYEDLIRTGGDLLVMERERFGIDHCQAGAWLMTEWKLPPEFVEAARNHHNPENDASSLTMLVHVGCSVAGQIGFGITGPEVPAPGAEPLVSDELAYSIAAAINALECECGL
jgi:putative nucleotidyltransferase with HDIG domain